MDDGGNLCCVSISSKVVSGGALSGWRGFGRGLCEGRGGSLGVEVVVGSVCGMWCCCVQRDVLKAC